MHLATSETLQSAAWDGEGGGSRRHTVVRFRSSPTLAARPEANFGIQDHWQLYDSSAPLNPKFAFGLAARYARTSGSGRWPQRPVLRRIAQSNGQIAADEGQ